jgi:hypothetical protein
MARERAARREPGAAQPDRSEAADAPEQGRSGLEELARAGAGLATGAAAAGLKLAGRAAGSLGRVVGRD